MTLDLEPLLQKLGHPGRFQIVIFFFLCLDYFPVSFNHLIMAFFGSMPNHQCYSSAFVTDNQSDSVYSFSEVHHTFNLPGSNSSNTTKVDAQKCTTSYYGPDIENVSITCPGDEQSFLIYMKGSRDTTIVTEWDLVCDRTYLSALATTIYFCGVMVGGLFFGHIADRFGRKPVMLATLYLPVVVGVGIYFIPSYIGFVVLRFIQGMLLQGLQISMYTMAMEYLPFHRNYVGAILESVWGTGMMLTPLLAYLIRDWRHLQLVISLPSILAFFYICFMPESLRWLIVNKKLDESEKLIERICTWNKIPFPNQEYERVKRQLEDGEKDVRSFSVIDLMKSPTLRKRSVILYYLWFAISVGYFGFVWQLTTLPGNKYLNFFIGGAVELVAYLSVMYITKRFGRKRPLLCYFTLASLFVITAGVIPIVNKDPSYVANGFAIAGKFAMGGLFAVIFIYTPELYPTSVRNIGLGTCIFWTRVGGVVAPQTTILDFKGEKSYPLILYGGLTLIGGLLTLLLPETLKTKFPDTIDDLDRPEKTSYEMNEPNSDDAEETVGLNATLET